MVSTMKKVLIIDDDEEDLNFVKEILEASSFECNTALTPTDGLSLALSWQPDIIVLDLMLPLMSGYGFLREVRKNPETAHIPILVLSSLRDKEIAAASVDMGATAYLSKDCINQNLISMVYEYSGHP
jgi:DNA-binding response OmpR family regulator